MTFSRSALLAASMLCAPFAFASGASALPGIADPALLAPARYAGPNCWGSSLAVVGIAQGQRHANAEEFSFWMGAACRRLDPGEARAVGDILALRMPFNDGGAMEIHAQTYLSAETSLSKNNSQPSSRLEAQRNADLFPLYGVPESDACRGNRSSDVFACEAAVDALRCQPLRLSSMAITPEESALALAIESAEALVVERLRAQSPLSPDAIDFAGEALARASSESSSIRPEILRGAAAVLSSLSDQMELLSLSEDRDAAEASRFRDLIVSAERSLLSAPKPPEPLRPKVARR